MSQLEKISLLLIGITLSGCMATRATFEEGWVYNEKEGNYLNGTEIKQLIAGNTIIYQDKYGTREFFDNDGTTYLFYKNDDNYHNNHWCIRGNKLCLDAGYKFDCPRIKIKQDGRMYYNDEKDGTPYSEDTLITIEQGDSYGIKETYKEYKWELHPAKHCVNNK